MSNLTIIIGNATGILAQGLVDWYKAGGSGLVYFMALLGAFCIIASTIRDSSKVFGTLFIFIIAFPILLIEGLIKKYKKKNGGN